MNGPCSGVNCENVVEIMEAKAFFAPLPPLRALRETNERTAIWNQLGNVVGIMEAKAFVAPLPPLRALREILKLRDKDQQ